MNYFSPHCPRCQKNDQVEMRFDGKHRYDKYYCRRCEQVFDSREGYPTVTESVYQVSESSITWSTELLPSSC